MQKVIAIGIKMTVKRDKKKPPNEQKNKFKLTDEHCISHVHSTYAYQINLKSHFLCFSDFENSLFMIIFSKKINK